jgi:hypothetical protein
MCHPGISYFVYYQYPETKLVAWTWKTALQSQNTLRVEKCSEMFEKH